MQNLLFTSSLSILLLASSLAQAAGGVVVRSNAADAAFAGVLAKSKLSSIERAVPGQAAKHLTYTGSSEMVAGRILSKDSFRTGSLDAAVRSGDQSVVTMSLEIPMTQIKNGTDVKASLVDGVSSLRFQRETKAGEGIFQESYDISSKMIDGGNWRVIEKNTVVADIPGQASFPIAQTSIDKKSGRLFAMTNSLNKDQLRSVSINLNEFQGEVIQASVTHGFASSKLTVYSVENGYPRVNTVEFGHNPNLSRSYRLKNSRVAMPAEIQAQGLRALERIEYKTITAGSATGTRGIHVNQSTQTAGVY